MSRHINTAETPPSLSLTAHHTANRLPDGWRETIARLVNDAVGPAPIFLIGSRGRGDALPGSDCDVSVIIPLAKIILATQRLHRVAGTLASEFGVDVSVNPVPKWSFNHGDRNLYILKIKIEGVRLDTDSNDAQEQETGLTLPASSRLHSQVVSWSPSTPSAYRAEVSYLITAVHNLLRGIEPHLLQNNRLDPKGETALQKAKAQVCQSYLLVRGQYVPSPTDAVTIAERLGSIPIDMSGANGFIRLQKQLLHVLGKTPIKRHGVRSVARDIQYVALSTMRGRHRWAVLYRYHGIERRLAAASLDLLQSLSVEAPNGYDANLLIRACCMLPAELRPPTTDYRTLRDTILSEWASAQPLVGIIP